MDDIPTDIKEPKGYAQPNLDNTIHDIICLDSFEKNLQPYIKDIIINKYSSVISLHAYALHSPG